MMEASMRWKLIVVFPFAIWIAVTHTSEYLHLRGAMDSPIVEGDIISRQKTRRSGGIPAGQLTIQIVGEKTTVTAITNLDDMKKLPRRVRFHFTGDPNREVFIEGEEHPFWVALFLWIASAGILLFCILPFFWKPFPSEEDEPGQVTVA
jgi:hypothetical protein